MVLIPAMTPRKHDSLRVRCRASCRELPWWLLSRFSVPVLTGAYVAAVERSDFEGAIGIDYASAAASAVDAVLYLALIWIVWWITRAPQQRQQF